MAAKRKRIIPNQRQLLAQLLLNLQNRFSYTGRPLNYGVVLRIASGEKPIKVLPLSQIKPDLMRRNIEALANRHLRHRNSHRQFDHIKRFVIDFGPQTRGRGSWRTQG